MKIYIITLLIIITSCKNDAKNSSIKYAESKELINAMCSKNNASQDWDKDTKYSYEIKDNFENKKPICFEGYVKDIYKTDSGVYIIKAAGISKASKMYNARIAIEEDALNNIRSKVKNGYTRCCFIIKVIDVASEITSISYGYNDPDNESDPVAVYSTDKPLYEIRGKLVDFCVLK